MIELMAPAGSFESMVAAIQAGANSVYFGIEQLNMRARATMNFTLEDIPKIVALCEKHNVRSYITLNTVIYDHDISLMKSIVNKAKNEGITAIIASDQSVISYAHSIGMEVHISTQTNVSNVESIRFYAHFADVVVLARELTMQQMKKVVDEIKEQQIKGPSGKLIQVEIFAHGALCMAVSGKCYLSLHSHNASANRGACIQNCRRSYKVTDIEEGIELNIENEYIMSPQDLCTINFLDTLLDTGIEVLKIEGRGRAPDYVYTVVSCYREAIDAYLDGSYDQDKIESWMKRLDQVYNRGFWGGYYLGKKMGEWSEGPGSQAKSKKIFIGKGVHYFPKIGVGEFQILSHSLKRGDQILITGPTTGVIESKVEEIRVNDRSVEEAQRGDACSILIPNKIRPSDKLYKIVDA